MEELERIIRQASTDQVTAAFWAAVAISIFLPRIPYGKNLMYPFALLGTWAHEFGHGVTAMLVGGSFHKLEIYSNLGGVATYSGVGKKTKAAVAAGGLLGPAIAGGVTILFGAKKETANLALYFLSFIILLSLIFFVRNTFGLVALALTMFALTGISFYSSEEVRMLLTQLIGIQFCVASWGTREYMFTKNFRRNGRVINSDTQDIAESLYFPYWFWGACIAFLSVVILAGSYYVAWIYPAQ